MNEKGALITNVAMEGDTLTVQQEQDVADVLRRASVWRDEDKGFNPLKGESMTFVGTIPGIVVAQWKQEGFDIHSPAKSNMTVEEHEKELLRRLQNIPAFLTSRHKRLV